MVKTMLISKPLTANDICTFKLTNGDEIIAKFISQDATGYTISKPVMVVIQPVSQAQMSLSFAPFMISTDDESTITIPLTAVLTKPAKTRSDVSSNYRRATSSLDTVSDIHSLIQ